MVERGHGCCPLWVNSRILLPRMLIDERVVFFDVCWFRDDMFHYSSNALTVVGLFSVLCCCRIGRGGGGFPWLIRRHASFTKG